MLAALVDFCKAVVFFSIFFEIPETRALTVGQCFACLVKTVNVCPNRCLVISSFQLTGFSFNN